MNAVPTKRIVLGDDYDDVLRRADISGGGQIFSPSPGVVQCHSPSMNDMAILDINLYLPRGSFIEVTCEAKQDDAYMGGRISIDQWEDSGMQAGKGAVADFISPDSRDWKPYKMVMPGDLKRPFTRVWFGQGNTGIGKSSYRNIVITVFNSLAQQPETRTCTFRKSASGQWYIDDDIGRFANFGVKEVTKFTDRIHVDWVELKSWYLPNVVANFHNFGSGKNYTVRPANITKTGCDFYFYFEDGGSSGNPINVDTMGECFVSFMAQTF
ncbi:hypothetical protein [Cytobacillus oceanisediminis]|uniref:hypothetical protein n=1 Tax=Cytobacillus oceanisediminis TaxID=665099 RepID=UPI001C22CE02|nr:hypothetical protein [Cytobacillus oceanisediminis]MBU8770335.1 hypothetical protein [Cytobacillus oceanisediminis]